MRGSPLFRALLAFLILLSLSWPLWRLTHPEAAIVLPVAPSSAPQSQEIHLQLTFSQTPTGLKILHLGEEVWSEPHAGTELERTLKLPFPKEGIELEFRFVWPGSPCAMRVRLRDPNGRQYERTIWGQGEVDEVVPFP